MVFTHQSNVNRMQDKHTIELLNLNEKLKRSNEQVELLRKKYDENNAQINNLNNMLQEVYKI